MSQRVASGEQNVKARIDLLYRNSRFFVLDRKTNMQTAGSFGHYLTSLASALCVEKGDTMFMPAGPTKMLDQHRQFE